jgi:hypothetical protein
MLYPILNRAHSGLRWVVLLLLLAAIVWAFQAWKGGAQRRVQVAFVRPDFGACTVAAGAGAVFSPQPVCAFRGGYYERQPAALLHRGAHLHDAHRHYIDHSRIQPGQKSRFQRRQRQNDFYLLPHRPGAHSGIYSLAVPQRIEWELVLRGLKVKVKRLKVKVKRGALARNLEARGSKLAACPKKEVS